MTRETMVKLMEECTTLSTRGHNRAHRGALVYLYLGQTGKTQMLVREGPAQVTLRARARAGT